MLTSDNKLLIYDFGIYQSQQDLIKHLITKGQLDSSNLKPIVSISPHKKQILDVAIPAGEETIVMTLSQDNTVKITDINTGKLLADIFLEDVPSCFCSVICKSQ
jgi:WD40 repeat protein